MALNFLTYVIQQKVTCSIITEVQGMDVREKSYGLLKKLI
jgi:hypothetical protein